MEALEGMLEKRARVIREGRQQRILAKDVVPGDVLVLHEGDRVAADGRVVRGNELNTQDAVLTGESMPKYKPEKSGKVYMGTNVVSGSALVIVTETGMKTEFGKIAHLTRETKQDKSPLQVELQDIGVLVVRVTIGLAILLVLFEVMSGETFLASLLFAAAVAVAAVPEGLPATITIALALGVQRLSKKNAIIKKLSSVETLGSTQVICTDKTGTLTKNEMTVVVARTNGDEHWFSGVGYNPNGEVKTLDKRLKILMRGFVLCQDAVLQKKGGKWSILGDPTEGALIVAAKKCGIEVVKEFKKVMRIKTLTFDSRRKMMTMIYMEGGKHVAYTKGAPDEILSKCTHVRSGKGLKKMTPSMRKEYHKEVEKYASEALRVLALATKNTFNSPEKGMIFEGMVGMMDPPREEVKDAVKAAKAAGIKIVMITGDAVMTAKAIAKILGICDTGRAIHGKELDKMGDRELKNILKEDVIFARVTPEHKLRIVDMFKQMKKVVAVTGDGVNDAPALKRADIGIAMGIAGTDVSREAADMVLTDDSFATIVKAIDEGRIIYENMKKFVFYVFGANTGELVTIFLALILGFPLPLTAILILLVNVGTDLLPALALGVDKPSENLMKSDPRESSTRIMDRAFILRVVYNGFFLGLIVTGLYLYVLKDSGDLVKAQTVAFATLVVIQMVAVFNSRSARRSVFVMGNPNWKLWGAVGLSLVAVVLMVQTPIAEYIGVVALSSREWMIIFAVSLGLLVVEELRKLVSRVNIWT